MQKARVFVRRGSLRGREGGIIRGVRVQGIFKKAFC